MNRCVLMLLVLPGLAFGQTDPLPAAQIVRQYAAHYRVPPELIGAFIDVESRWNRRYKYWNLDRQSAKDLSAELWR